MSVATTNKEYDAQLGTWQKIRDCLAGSDAVKAAGSRYLPRPSGMDSTEFAAYVQRAVFYNATSRTLSGLTGALFRKRVQLTNWPTQLEPNLANVNLRGSPLDAFAKDVAAEVVGLGRVLIVADMPAQEGGQPYLCLYRAVDVPNWAVDYSTGVPKLTRVVVREAAHAPDPNDEFAEKEVERRRVFALERAEDGSYGFYYQEVWEKNADQAAQGKPEEWVRIKGPDYPVVRGNRLKFIPAQFCGPTTLTPDIERSPILDLVDINLSHYATSADREHALHWTALPTPWAAGGFGAEQKDLRIGSTTAWLLPENAEVGMLEFTGAGLDAMAKSLEQKERQMAVLGARLLEDQKNAAEAGVTVRLRHSGENSALASIADTIGRALKNALTWYAAFAGATADKLEAQVNKDFFDVEMDAQTLTSLVGAWQSGGIGLEVLHHNLQRGEVLPEGMGLDEYRADIEQNGASALLGPPADPGMDDDDEEAEASAVASGV